MGREGEESTIGAIYYIILPASKWFQEMKSAADNVSRYTSPPIPVEHLERPASPTATWTAQPQG